MATGRRGYRTVKVQLPTTELMLYGSARLVEAVQDLVNKMRLYEGVKLAQIMETVYLQGKKDGAREAFENVDKSLTQAKKTIPHNRPGRPKGT